MEKIKAKAAVNAAIPGPAGAVPKAASEELAKAGAMIARPADLPAYVDVSAADGLENAGDAGLQLPLLLLAQPLTPQVVDGKLKPGDVVLNSDAETALIHAGGSLNFVPFYHFNEWIQWAPRETGEGILARSKDPRGELAKLAARQLQDLREKREGNSDEPRVTKYHVFFVLLDGQLAPVAITMSRTKFKKGQQLLALALRRGPKIPLYAGKYQLTSVLEKNKKGQSYFNYDFKANGWATEAEYVVVKQAYAHAKEAFEATTLRYESDEPVAEADDVGTAPPTAGESF